MERSHPAHGSSSSGYESNCDVSYSDLSGGTHGGVISFASSLFQSKSHLVEVDVEGSAEHNVEVGAVGFPLIDQRLAAADLLALHVVHEDVDLLLVHRAE